MGRLAILAAMAAIGATGSARAATAPAPPAAPAAAPPACETASYGALLPRLNAAPRRAVLPATPILPEGGSGDLIMIGAVGAGASLDDYSFRVFTAPGRYLPSANEVDRPGGFLADHADRPSADLAKTLRLNEPQTAIDLRVVAPVSAGGEPWRYGVVVVVACLKGGVAGVGDYALWESRPAQTGWVAFAILAGLYLLTVTAVWRSRKRAAAKVAIDRAQLVPPRRLIDIKAWTWVRCLDPVVLTSDENDRGSLANLQVLFFALIVGFGLTNLALRQGALSNLSSSIVLLLGIPAGGSVASRAVSLNRDRIGAANWAWLVSLGVLPVNDVGKQRDDPRWSDLILRDGSLDLPKLQALMFSLIVGIAMVVTGYGHLADFDVPSSLLQILGISQGVLLAGKITQVPNLKELDDALTELRQRAADLARAAASGRDVTADGKISAESAPRAEMAPFASLPAAAARDAVPNAAQRYRDIEARAVVLLQSVLDRDIDAAPLADPLRTGSAAA